MTNKVNKKGKHVYKYPGPYPVNVNLCCANFLSILIGYSKLPITMLKMKISSWLLPLEH